MKEKSIAWINKKVSKMKQIELDELIFFIQINEAIHESKKKHTDRRK